MALQLPNIFDKYGTEVRVFVDFEFKETKYNQDRHPIVWFAKVDGGRPEVYAASTVLECAMAGTDLLTPIFWPDEPDIEFPSESIRSVANGILKSAPYSLGEFTVSWGKRSPEWHLLPF